MGNQFMPQSPWLRSAHISDESKENFAERNIKYLNYWKDRINGLNKSKALDKYDIKHNGGDSPYTTIKRLMLFLGDEAKEHVYDDSHPTVMQMRAKKELWLEFIDRYQTALITRYLL